MLTEQDIQCYMESHNVDKETAVKQLNEITEEWNRVLEEEYWYDKQIKLKTRGVYYDKENI